MDQNETSTDLTTELETDSFGLELGKMFVRSTVTSAGVWTGILASLYAIGAASNYWTNRKAKKAQNDPTTTA